MRGTPLFTVLTYRPTDNHCGSTCFLVMLIMFNFKLNYDTYLRKFQKNTEIILFRDDLRERLPYYPYITMVLPEERTNNSYPKTKYGTRIFCCCGIGLELPLSVRITPWNS